MVCRPNSVLRIKKQAESFNTFSTIDVYYNNNIYMTEFKNKFSYVLNQKEEEDIFYGNII